MSFHVLDPGLASRVVDFGRPASRSLGVPVGGAADSASLILGNALVGNPAHAPALEITLKGPILRPARRVGCVLYGAPFDLSSARQQLRTGRTFTLEPDEELHIAGTASGMRAYLCVVGGFDVPLILNSRSALAHLRRGDRLDCRASEIAPRFLAEPIAIDAVGPLRCLPGLQADWFDLDDFVAREFVVSPALDRMGIRLQGEPLAVPPRELVSEPVCPGAVQVTRDGQCILLGVDGQTIGGYPKIVQVIAADIDRLGQLRPGERLRFALVDYAAARRLFLEKQRTLQDWSLRLMAATAQ